MNISEIFYSVQGEGPSTGIPIIFVRLSGCNLMCGGSNGSLITSGKATWKCDTEKIWKHGDVYNNFDLLQAMLNLVEHYKIDLMDALTSHTVHICFTGGEPLLQEEAIAHFLQFIRSKFGFNPFVELETNGTIIPQTALFYTDYISQINCSPKLANSGMKLHKRVNADAIKKIRKFHNSFFKFVIFDEDDIDEILYYFIDPFSIDPAKIYIMPAAENREELITKLPEVIELSKKYLFKVSDRLHIAAWDTRVGV